ncbi:MAG TPA: M28 family peptidase [Longimicrobiaceae bacterium]|nr:M28 family peptidase [Longimicrobiaceae bacterium]
MMAALAAWAAPVAAQSAGNGATGRSAAVRAEDLRARLTAFAHDSMEGREAGTPGHDRAAAYLARELARLGLRPAGEGGSFYQEVPLIHSALDRSVVLTVDGAPLRPEDEYTPLDQRSAIRSLDGAQVLFGGRVPEAAALTPEQVAGKVVVFLYQPGGPLLPPSGASSNLAGAAGVALTGIDSAYTGSYSWTLIRASSGFTYDDSSAAKSVKLLLHSSAARKMFGRPLEELRQGDTGKRLGGDVRYVRTSRPTRNVVAVLPGTDPRLRGQYVALGAHSDHDGVRWGAADHDSLRAYLQALRQREGQGGDPLPAAEQERIAREVARRPGGARSRPDSIFNGADDDGSGSIALLELAEHFVDPANRPRRSLLFVWHTAEEKGLQGSQWFTDHPTVPRDSIVAQINVDMIGRGGSADLPNGGPDYLQLLGSRRLSTQLGDLVEAANAGRPRPFRLDYQYDADGHPENYYCRSDHWNYARYGIPVVFFSTGGHADYHRVTDEVQYIDFEHYTRVTDFIGDVARRVANLDRRPVVDRPRPDPNGPCRQ